MQSITLSPAHVHSIASAATATAKRDNTVLLEGVQLSVSAGVVTALATDRYRVARITFATESAAAELEPVTISGALLAAFAKSLKTAKVMSKADAVTLTIDGGRVVLAHESGLQLAGEIYIGNFPPVGRLIDGYKVGDVRDVYLKPAFVADAAKLSLPGDTKPADAKEAAWLVRFSDSGSSKPGPVLMTRRGVATQSSGSIEYMVQPNSPILR
jgi:hypothetical protein